jgi:glycosyltransferase involved in cell wall biosynthesis
MAAQKPTILAIDGVIRDVIESSGGGIFVPPGDSSALVDAILKYHDSPQLMADHGRKAREYVREHFERENIAMNLERILSAVGAYTGR